MSDGRVIFVDGASGTKGGDSFALADAVQVGAMTMLSDATEDDAEEDEAPADPDPPPMAGGLPHREAPSAAWPRAGRGAPEPDRHRAADGREEQRMNIKRLDVDLVTCGLDPRTRRPRVFCRRLKVVG